MTDYENAKKLGLTTKNRWEDGIPHHPESMKIMEFLGSHDLNDYDDWFCWKWGGDGDNGEALMFQLDAYFEMRDKRGENFLKEARSKADERIANITEEQAMANIKQAQRDIAEAKLEYKEFER